MSISNATSRDLGLVMWQEKSRHFQNDPLDVEVFLDREGNHTLMVRLILSI